MNIEAKLDLEAINQTLEVIKGKWKIPIITTLSLLGQTRFSDLSKNIEGIGSKMLSKELKALESNELIKRIVLDTAPVTVVYELTRYGQTLDSILIEMSKWGTLHSQQVKGVNPNSEINHFLTFDI